MYPYNIQKSSKNNTAVTDVNTRENKKALHHLAKDKQFLEMLAIAVEEAKHTEEIYESLSKKMKDKKDAEDRKSVV